MHIHYYVSFDQPTIPLCHIIISDNVRCENKGTKPGQCSVLEETNTCRQTGNSNIIPVLDDLGPFQSEPPPEGKDLLLSRTKRKKVQVRAQRKLVL